MKIKKVILMIAVIIGIIYTYLAGVRTEASDIQKEIAENVLRFHVIANSDSEEDQALKMKVKEAVISYLEEDLNQENLSLEETKAIVEEKKEDVIRLAEQVIRENGYDYSVSAELTKDYFPIKAYGDAVLPAGEYEAFRIEIGDSKGKNWWCILYPPLCFVDVTYGYVPEESKEMLKNVLDEECYKTVMGGGVANGEVEVHFKLWDMICGK